MRPALLFAVVVLLSLSSGIADENQEVSSLSEIYGLRKEVILSDGTRVDLVSEDHAIEVDWSQKWAEAVGQSLHYGYRMGKTPGIILIKKKETDEHLHEAYLNRCKLSCGRLGIMLWTKNEGSDDVKLVYPSNPFDETRIAPIDGADTEGHDGPIGESEQED